MPRGWGATTTMESDMTRNLLATVAATFATFTVFASAAQACISCEYVPEVVREHQTHNTASASYHRSRGTSAALLRNRTAKARIAKRRAAAKIQTASVAPAKAQPKSRRSLQTVAVSQPTSTKIDASEVRAAALPVADTKTETSAISTSSITPVATAEPKIETTAKTETTPKEEKPAQQAKANTQVGCKKFLPAVGVTLTVACK